MDLSNAHRKWIFGNKTNDIPHVEDYISEKIKVYSSNEQSINWLDNFIDITKDTNLTSNNLFCNKNIILTWTNKKCNKYNQYVREKIFNKKNLDKYEIGEILIFNDFHRIQIPGDPDFIESKNVKTISFYTSEQVKLFTVEKSTYKLDKLKNQINSILPINVTELFKKKITSINKLLDEELEVYKMSVKKISEMSEDPDSAILYDLIVIHNNSENVYLNIINTFEEKILKLRNLCYKTMNSTNKKDNHMKKSECLDEIDKKINKIWKNWQTNVIDRFAQLNYGYSITVHKSQGSTFKNVFIDISDILDNNNTNEVSKCLYTAITRSSDTLELLI
jgi:hypothetical protein